jgi:hypothetical protein
MNEQLLKQMGVYVQKSRTFLWPLLNLKVKPVETYLKFGDLNNIGEARILIALFYNGAEDYKKYKSEIENHKCYDFTFVDDDFDLVTFNFYSMKNDYDKIVNGEYSKISSSYKLFMSALETNPVILKCLEPESNYVEIADLLETNPEELRGKELLSPPNFQEETIFVRPIIKEMIMSEYSFS